MELLRKEWGKKRMQIATVMKEATSALEHATVEHSIALLEQL